MGRKPTLSHRQELIYNQLLNDGEVKINALTDQYEVVEMTIRRDLEKMEKMGLVKRTFGGAIPNSSSDTSLTARENLHVHAKQMIGKRAVQVLTEGEAVFVDAGTTTPNLVKHLPLDMELIIVTNALNVATNIRGNNKERLLVGGVLIESTMSLVGPIAEKTLNDLSFDRAFIAASGLSIEHGLSNSNGFEVQIKQTVMKQSREVNVLIDHSKFGTQFLHKITAFEGVDRIITDKKPTEKCSRAIREAGIDLVVCAED